MKPSPTTHPLRPPPHPQQTSLPSQSRTSFIFSQCPQTPSKSRDPLQTLNPFGLSPFQKAHFPSKPLPRCPQNQSPTRFLPHITNLSPNSSPLNLQHIQEPRCLNHLQSLQSSPQFLSLSNFPGLKQKYEDFMRRREDIRRKIAQICQMTDEKAKEKELRELNYTKPNMEEALVLQNMLRKAGSNIAFQKEILEIERDIELSNSYFQKLQGVWLRYETQLSDWRRPQNLDEIDDLLQSIWNGINKLLVHDPVLLEEKYRFVWFCLANVVLKHNRTDCEFPYIKYCQDLKKSAEESQDEKRKKSLIYRRIKRELQKHKKLIGKVKRLNEDIEKGMDIERIDVGNIESLLKELKSFGFGVNEKVQYLEEILRKTSQLKHLSLVFEEENSLKQDEGPSVQILETREDQEEKMQGIFLVENPPSQIIEAEQSCFRVESFNISFEATQEEQKMRKISVIDCSFSKVILPEKSKEKRLRQKAIARNISQKMTEVEQPNSVEFLKIESYKAQEEGKLRKSLTLIDSPSSRRKTINQSPISKQPLPTNSSRNPWQREREQNMKSLISEARVVLSQKKKLPYKLAEKICLQFAEHHLKMPEAEKIFNRYFQEINRIQRYSEDLTSQLQVLTFEDLCIWSENTRSMKSNLEGGYDEIKAELWIAKARSIKILWENLAKSSKPICFREIRNLIVESENYEDVFTGIKKAIFQDFVSFLKNLVKKIFRKVQKKANKTEILLKNGIVYGFIDIKKELSGEIQESKGSKKMTQKPASNFPKEQIESCSENLNKKRNAREVEDSEIIFFDSRAKKLKTEVNNKEEVLQYQKKIQESKVKGILRDGNELMNKGEVLEDCICISSDSDETMAGSEIEEVDGGRPDSNKNLANLEQLNKKLWNDMSYSRFKFQKKEYYDFDKSQEI